MLSAIEKIVKEITRDINQSSIVAMGIGVPGIVHPNSGEIVVSVSKGWIERKVPVKDHFEKTFHVPVFVANRSRIAALGEHKAGVGKDVENLIYLFIGQGISAGIVIDGHLYFGPGSCAGEIGHISIDPEGPLCECGNRGCLEVFATEKAILAQARAIARENLSLKLKTSAETQLDTLSIANLVELIDSEDSPARKVFESVGLAIGKSLAILINLLNPEMVILGGPIGSSTKDLILLPAQKEALKRALPISLQSTRIVTGTLGSEATTIGAAVFALNQISIDHILGESKESSSNDQ